MFAVLGGSLVSAASTQDYGPGGTISGTVVGPAGNVVDWAQIYAHNGNLTYQAFSGFSGFYLMRVPAGTYNVTVYDFYNPTYWAQNASVNVTDGSVSTVNFYLQYPVPQAMPEYSPDVSVLVCILGLAAVSVVARRLRMRSVSS